MTKAFLKGEPTEIDRAKLRAAFPVESLAEGRRLPWEALELALEADRYPNLRKHCWRFRTVVGAWRSELRRLHNIVLGAECGKGLYVLSHGQRVTVDADNIHKGMRRVRRAHTDMMMLDDNRLTDEERRGRDHTMMVAATMLQGYRAIARQARPELKGIAEGKTTQVEG